MGDCKTWIDEVADVENEGNAELLATIAKKDSRWYCRGAAVNKLNAMVYADHIADRAMWDENYVVRQKALAKLDAAIPRHRELLEAIADHAQHEDARDGARAKLNAG